MKSKIQFLIVSLLALVASAAQADQYEFQLREIPTNRLLISKSMVLLSPSARIAFADMTRRGYLKSCTSNEGGLPKVIPGEIEFGTEVVMAVPDGDKPPQLQVVHTELEKIDEVTAGLCTIQVPVVRTRLITGAVVSAPVNVWQSFPIEGGLMAEMRRVN